PDRIWHPAAGLLLAADRDAAGAGFAWRLLRIPLSGRTGAPCLGCRIRPRINRRGADARFYRRRPHPGADDRWRAFQRQRLRCLSTVLPSRRSVGIGGVHGAWGRVATFEGDTQL